MRIGLLSDSDVFAGTERHMLDLARALKARVWAVSLLCPRKSVLAERAASAGITVVPVPNRLTKAILEIRGQLRGGAFDIIHTHNGRTSLIATTAARLARRGLVVSTQHFIEPSRLRRRGVRAWISGHAHSWVERRTSRFIAISAAVRDAMLLRRDTASGKIVIIHNGIEPPRVQGVARAELVGPSAKVITCIARLEAEKDVGTLVEAMAIVSDFAPNSVCLHAGGGSQKEVIDRRIAQLGLQANMRLLGFRNDVEGLLDICDVFVLPSPAEPFGLAILEAMALGKPVIAAAAGGPLEIIVQGESGLLIPPSDPKALAKAILQLLSDPNLRERIGNAARARFFSHFTADRMAEDTLRVYRSVLEDHCTSDSPAARIANLQTHVPLEGR